MAKVAIYIEEEDVPLVQCLLDVKAALDTPRGDIILHQVDGKIDYLEINKRVKIKEHHRKLTSA